MHVHDVAIPLSLFLSPEARQLQLRRARAAADQPPQPTAPELTLDEMVVSWRAASAAFHRDHVARLCATYDVVVRPEMIGGVQTDVVEPRAGVAVEHRRRVLINLHGGGWFLGARWEGQSLSVPVAGIGGMKVVTVDYRMAPEYRHPAAAEDIAAVYAALLEEYAPEDIGLYGHSAGGALAAQAVAWFQRVGLPRPGAIGVLGSAVGLVKGGDSFFTNAIFSGLTPEAEPYRTSDSLFSRAILLYWEGTDYEDPVITPCSHPEVIAGFPPTLVLNSIRDHTLSDAVYGHTRLVHAGVDAELHVWEGLGHGFLCDVETPEFVEAYDVIVKFFGSRLGRVPSSPPM